MFWIILGILVILTAIIIGYGFYRFVKMVWEEAMGDDEDEGFYSGEIPAGANDHPIEDKHWPD